MRLAAAATFLPVFVLAYVVTLRPVYATDLNNYLLCSCGFSCCCSAYLALKVAGMGIPLSLGNGW